LVLPRGAQVAGYEIGDVLGRGGMAVVYAAREPASGREVALKVFALANGMDPSFRRRFQREGRLQAAIDHPGIVTVYEAGEWEDALFIAMRLVRGANLKDLTIAGGLESERLLRILTPIADALDAAHAAGLIHRDVKPQNILIGEGDRAFLADFGLTKAPTAPSSPARASSSARSTTARRSRSPASPPPPPRTSTRSARCSTSA
jgi:serine/threonine protein kinase